MKISPIALALTLAVCFTPALAHAEHLAGADTEMHCKMDMPDMSPAEHHKKMDEMFASMDANKNGSISKVEFTSHHEAMMKKHHEGMGKADHGCKMDMDHKKMDMEEKKDSGK